MKIRSELSMEAAGFGPTTERPLDDSQLDRETTPFVNPDLHSPENAEQLARIREHCIERPEGVLLDVYQAVTTLELKYPPGTLAGQERYLDGLRGEVAELHGELMMAQMEHPYSAIVQSTEGPEDSWLATVLDPNRLRFVHLTPERKEKYLGELGDVMWYCSRIAAEMDCRLSHTVVDFLRHVDAGMISRYDAHGYAEAINRRAGEILDFELVQEIAQSQKRAFTERAGVSDALVTIDNMPHRLLGAIHADELWPPRGVIDDWPEKEPYRHIPTLRQTVGKLVWFSAYTANSLLNADFSIVMKANLQKVRARSQRGTIFSKQDRDAADESPLKADSHPREPIR